MCRTLKKQKSDKEPLLDEGDTAIITLAIQEKVERNMRRMLQPNLGIIEDFSEKEADDFISSLNSQQFLEVQKFFETMPKLKHMVKIKNPKTEVESDVPLEGLQSFF